MSHDQVIQVLYSRTVPAENQQRYESWLDRLLQAARCCDGYLSSQILRPQPPNNDYHVIAVFSSLQSAQQWEENPERLKLLEESAAFSNDTVRRTIHQDQTFWLDLNLDPGRKTLIKWRMACLLFIVVSSLVLAISPLLQLALPGLPGPVRLLLAIAIDVILMTYLILPFLTKKLEKVLYSHQ